MAKMESRAEIAWVNAEKITWVKETQVSGVMQGSQIIFMP